MTEQTWTIDAAHSGVHFTVRHMVVSKVRGKFGRFSGTITYDAARPAASSVVATIDVSSIDTGVEQRDGHLKSADFFDAARFPEMTFRSKHAEPAGADRLRLTGDLTIRGVTREVSLDVELGGRAKDPWGGERVGFSARTSLDRKEFGLTWNQALEAGGVLVGDRVDIELEVEAVSAASQKAA